MIENLSFYHQRIFRSRPIATVISIQHKYTVYTQVVTKTKLMPLP